MSANSDHFDSLAMTLFSFLTIFKLLGLIDNALKQIKPASHMVCPRTSICSTRAAKGTTSLDRLVTERGGESLIVGRKLC